jgi:hypothetical protein
MSEVKVNKISPRTACGTVTLGDSGDTFTIPAGATITNNGTAAGFGATGAASWDTTVKTGDFTAVSGEGYFVNTTSGEIDVTLPASPSAGAVVAIKDYANTWDTNNCILLRNGSNIGGNALNSTLSIEGLAVTLVYVDATKGWLVTDSGLQNEAPGPEYITATGGTITCSGNFRIHTFTGPGTFCVSAVGNSAGSTLVDYMVVAGGGAGGSHGGDGGTVGGGGGAGGYRESPGTASGSYSVSPLGAAPAVSLPVSITGFPITVGAGGVSFFPGNCAPGAQGSVSTFSTITSAGGGAGNGQGMTCAAKGDGGSGGGGRAASSGVAGGTGNTPPVSPVQGTNGGAGNGPQQGGGGGGAASAGSPAASPLPANTGRGGGGIGATSSINATPTQRAGGGGGANTDVPDNGGAGGGGKSWPGASGGTGCAGTVNTGGGGGAGPHSKTPTNNAGNGGSGIVVIRYKFQN